MKALIVLLFLFFSNQLSGQKNEPGTYGFRHMQTVFKGDTVDILIKSKKGEESKPKPLFLFCQGSMPIPLIIKYDENGKEGIYNVFVFNPDSLSNDYHLAIISKPYIPLIVDQKNLNSDLTYRDSAGKTLKKYVDRNLLDYYVDRAITAIKFLQAQQWISKSKLVVAGHSEGSTVAAKVALKFPAVTHLIYSGGNPLGRILTILERQRALETDTLRYAEGMFMQWESIVADPSSMEAPNGDTNKGTYDFSIPPFQYLEKLTIPVLVSYGTKDASSPFNDYLRVETIRKKRKNFTFKAYIGTEHNYFPVRPDGEINYDIFNWDKVAEEWRQWLQQQ